ncbi:GNAT family protein [Clostridium sp. CCUG 7971]|uniref:GNAT family N-acetyltransferase n=1 Tax=Clostridium sp. CCUG 7971 TaxID=2811414 RepID=UPI001ABA86A3|nr:GNAT family protein [Clostridium sp. CCUG 7971]MBO3445623.1 GNAT family N-acetyltransferase [Clostridium sp. CCUG 7971]
MNDIIKKSKNITLRRTKSTDLEFVISLEREPYNAQYVGQWSKERHMDSLKDRDIVHLIVEDSNTSKPIGYIIMGGIENKDNNIEFRRVVISDKGKGFGRETLKLIKEFSFNQLGAHRLWLDVRCKNTKAQNLYKSEGFKEEGTLRECVIYNGSYESIIIMSILEHEYKNN